MTRSEFQIMVRGVQTAIVDKIKAGVDLNTTRVIGRDAFDEDGAAWLSNLAAPDGKYHCWTVSYMGTAGLEDEQNPVATEQYLLNFLIVGYHYYDFGTDADNSTRKFMDEINGLRYDFMNDLTLGLASPVEHHNGFLDQTVLGTIDNRPIHISKVLFGVTLEPISYEYA